MISFDALFSPFMRKPPPRPPRHSVEAAGSKVVKLEESVQNKTRDGFSKLFWAGVWTPVALSPAILFKLPAVYYVYQSGKQFVQAGMEKRKLNQERETFSHTLDQPLVQADEFTSQQKASH
jgi:hypothetical protein